MSNVINFGKNTNISVNFCHQLSDISLRINQSKAKRFE